MQIERAEQQRWNDCLASYEIEPIPELVVIGDGTQVGVADSVVFDRALRLMRAVSEGFGISTSGPSG